MLEVRRVPEGADVHLARFRCFQHLAQEPHQRAKHTHQFPRLDGVGLIEEDSAASNGAAAGYQ